MDKKIENIMEILAELQKSTSEILSFADTCESIVNGVSEKTGKNQSGWSAEIQEYRDRLKDAYMQAEDYLVEVSRKLGEEIEVKSSPIAMGEDYRNTIVNMSDSNKAFVLQGIEEKISALLEKSERTLENLSILGFNGGVAHDYYMSAEEASGMMASAVKGVMATSGLKNKDADSSSEK